MTKSIFVTGGVVSGLGKGITAASLGRRLSAWRKIKIEWIDFEGLTETIYEEILSGADGIIVSGTLRSGAYPCNVVEGTTMARCYGCKAIFERHRHRYEFNNAYKEAMEGAGMRISGISPDGRPVEAVELTDRAFHVGVQYHPEFKSRLNKPHALFVGFVNASLKGEEK